MPVSSVSVALFKKMVMNGAINLKNNHKRVDELNVFPVPDGDTGTNMSMTVMSGVREMDSCESSSIIEVGKVLSRGALMGARGNSGVILSQFFRGLYVGMKELDHNFLSIEDLMTCFESGCRVAYKAVMEPVEGTILTVVREAAENTRAHMSEFNTIDALLECYQKEAQKSLDNTPNLLPVLKESGVVDSGGAGFLEIVKGMIMALNGKMLEANEGVQPTKTEEKPVEMKNIYCTEFFINLKDAKNFDEGVAKSSFSCLGDSLCQVIENTTCKVHLHTDHPGRVLEQALKYGELTDIKIENQKIQHTHLKTGAKEIGNGPKKAFALVAVCFGEGISQTFKDLGVDHIIEGGQTMNPSTEAFVEACTMVNAEKIIIIPNNGNVVMAASQAAGLVKGSKVEVLKAKTIAQGYASLMVFDPEADMETNLAAMMEAVENVKTGEITYSVRDTEIGGVKIAEGDFMGIANGEIVVSTKKQSDALENLLNKLIDEESQIVTFFCGKDVKEEEKEVLEELCQKVNESVEVEIIDGEQDIYSYIIAVE
ncbi:MAG: DAK2 domain-containing protein [Anaeroplasmataceae bacterium]|nr:DAK2 domain-containing protein [Anaeroplasmataceae bacterium]MDE6414834.1 DAK2 domain-containing protein [Anaeroplasmataceae bacterium]